MNATGAAGMNKTAGMNATGAVNSVMKLVQNEKVTALVIVMALLDSLTLQILKPFIRYR